jgi:5-formyltetrahydrofolate cyclo-ligase
LPTSSGVINSLNKTLHRKSLRAVLKKITPEQKVIAASKALSFLEQDLSLITLNRIGLYCSTEYEFDTEKLISRLLELQKNIYLPKIDILHKKMCFARFDNHTKLIKNVYGITEPDKMAEIIDLSELQLVLIPLVGFDSCGTRLGAGGGYYDRYLRCANELTIKPLLLGLAFANQELPMLPKNQWDIPLDGVLTERGLRYFTKQCAEVNSNESNDNI